MLKGNWDVMGLRGRDLHVGTGHMVFDDRNYTELAKPRLGLEPAPF